MKQSEVIKYYSRKDVCNEIIRFSKNREVATRFREGSFGKRPDVLHFPQDIISQVRNGAISFHASEERWSNPLKISSELTSREFNELREGWDLILDIDCKDIEFSRVCAELLLDALDYHGLESSSIKFSGGSGFHIGVPFEALSKSTGGKETKDMFPEMPRIVAEYLRSFISSSLTHEILSIESDLKKIGERVDKKTEELFTETERGKEFDPYTLIEIDTLLISQRHLIRVPYSLNEKKGLVSISFKKKELKNFTIDWAKPENIKVNNYFLNTEKVNTEDAKQLLVQAWDWKEKKNKDSLDKFKEHKEIITLDGKISEEHFPPCIKKLLLGISDGKKRSLFILLNFLRRINWGWKEIENTIQEWNKKNSESLKEGYIKSQINWHKKQNTSIPPPNCDASNYYIDINLCTPDNLCKKIKNPLTYSAIKNKSLKKLERNYGSEKQNK